MKAEVCDWINFFNQLNRKRWDMTKWKRGKTKMYFKKAGICTQKALLQRWLSAELMWAVGRFAKRVCKSYFWIKWLTLTTRKPTNSLSTTEITYMQTCPSNNVGGCVCYYYFFKQDKWPVSRTGTRHRQLLWEGDRHVLCLCPYAARSGLLSASPVGCKSNSEFKLPSSSSTRNKRMSSHCPNNISQEKISLQPVRFSALSLRN